jgi:flagellar basal body-associated protein FliL
MKEKVELDILELDLPKEADSSPDGATSLTENGEPDATKQSRLKKTLPVFLFLVLCMAGVLCWIYFGGDWAGEDGKKNFTEVAPGERFVSLEHFAVNIKDGQGNYRVLLCDVTVELNGSGAAVQDKTLELRKIVYRSIRNRGLEVIQKTPKISSRLVKEMENELNGILGEGVVKQIYFTKYTLLERNGYMDMKYLESLIIFIVLLIPLNYSYALTPEQIVRLKEAGVEDKTIQLMIQQEREVQAREREEVVDLPGTREIKDGTGSSAVIYSTGKSRGDEAGDSEKEKAEKAWKMLQHMVIDHRR